MRSPTRSRYYIQCVPDENLADWPDARLWDELRLRFGQELPTAPAIEKSIATLRSFVAEPMRHGHLFLAGDADHIVPPTGAKGLNLALADVGVLHKALAAWYQRSDSAGIEAYSATCLRRVWRAVRFSWWMTTLLHRVHDPAGFEHQLQRAERDALATSETMRTMLAENYVGLPD